MAELYYVKFIAELGDIIFLFILYYISAKDEIEPTCLGEQYGSFTCRGEEEKSHQNSLIVQPLVWVCLNRI